MKLNTTPRVGVNDPQLTRELRNVATAVNLLADGRLAGTNNATTAAPTTGAHALGDFVRNSNPSGSAPIFGWVCTVAGTPGTWVAVQGGGGVGADHGSLTGLGDDDHTQYHNDARGDARYVALTGNQSVAGEKTFTSPTVVEVSSASAALRITQTGAGNSIAVEDSTSPDSTPFIVDAAGRVVTGHTAALTRYYDPQTTTQRNPTFQRHGAAVEGAGAAFTSWSASAGGFYAPALWLAKSKSATVGTNTIVASGERLGTLMFSGDDGAKFIGAAQIQCTTDAAPALDSMPGALVFSTTASGASTSTERMRVSSIGDVRIATTTRSGTAMLTVSGEAAATSFTGAGTGLTGTGASFTAGAATNVAGGAANKIVYQTGAGATGFIDAPTSGSTYLRWNAGGTAFEWGTVSGSASYVGCRAYNDGTQSIPNNSSTAVTFNTEEWDTDAIHDTSSNTSRFTVPSGKAGKWRFTWKVGFASNTTGSRVVFLRKNGGTDANNVIGSSVEFTPPSTIHLQGSSTVDLSVGDYIEMFIYQNSGGSLNIGSTIASNRGTATAMEAQFLG